MIMKHQTADAVISAQGVTVAVDPVVIGDRSREAPQVSVVRSGGDVVTIEIRCRCGELIVLDCDYESPAGT